MNNGLNEEEKRTWDNRYSYCKHIELREDLVFVYPNEFRGEADIVANKLQDGMDYLKYVCDLNSTHEFRRRTVIGYRHPNDEGGKECCPGWLPNWINIPWNYLYKKPEQNEPLDACSHELVHPYYNRSLLHNSNEEWGDCFCEFLRGPIKNVMGLDGKAWWREKIKDKKSDKQNWGNVAGQFLLKAKEKYGAAKETDGDFADRFIEDRGAIKDFVKFLFDSFSELPMCLAFYPTTKVKLKFGDI